eukprot:TRINITY_DN33684_c0_g1_i1.p1 TRINITY_DN33684_c0_g1~~TRINITY_DN33684_c0_g1_i1.p1  ORF type:complete len:473 (+),score=94.51 TRINITY_DN33684_c0_g1_i1:51-1469(+)
MRVLDYVVPILSVLPEIEKPRRKQDVTDKLIWTGMALFIFLICSQLPVYGIRPKEGSDPLHFMRMVLASNKGTLMELGISPIVTASLVMQFLQGARLISYNENSSRDRKVFSGAQKAFGLIITVVEAVAYVFSGAYGDVRDIGSFSCVLIVTQLVIAGVICLLLDEMLQKGYGFGNGISLFISTNICEAIFWKAFSPFMVNTGRGQEFEGAIVSLFHQLVQSTNKVKALKDAFYRPHLPNVMSLLSTGVVFLIVIYTQGFAVNIGLQHEATRQMVPQKIKLFYTSNMPIVLQTALISNLYFISSMLHKKFADSPIVGLLGTWGPSHSGAGPAVPLSGLVYYVSPPQGFADAVSDPVHAVFYVVFMVFGCAFFSKSWVAVSNQTSKELAQEWHRNGLILPGRKSRDNLQQVVERYVPTAAALGGICIGLLTILADLLGAVGSGTGVLLAVTFIYSYYEQLEQEKYLPTFLSKK